MISKDFAGPLKLCWQASWESHQLCVSLRKIKSESNIENKAIMAGHFEQILKQDIYSREDIIQMLSCQGDDRTALFT